MPIEGVKTLAPGSGSGSIEDLCDSIPLHTEVQPHRKVLVAVAPRDQSRSVATTLVVELSPPETPILRIMVEEARRTHSADFLVVGIGASAGGIQAIKRFFEHVPPDSGIAFVVVLHLSPEHESRLAEVLQVSARIPVNQVQQRIRVEPNHVYVIPPDQSLSIDEGHLVLSDVTRFEERRAPVDIFFRTLADSHRSKAVCVVLSGTGADGSMGMKRVKEQGGLCLVQDPDEAEYSDMPRNSIATALVDHVLPVADMPAWILAYRDSLGSVRLPEQPSGQTSSHESSLREILSQLKAGT